MRIPAFILFLACLFPAVSAHSTEPIDPVTSGIQLYRTQCAICHEKLSSSTGLITRIRTQFPNSEGSAKKLYQYLNDKISRGGHADTTLAFLPQWMHLLNSIDRQSLVHTLERVVKSGTGKLDVPASTTPPGQLSELGSVSFRLRCTNCHGITGHGDGHMTRFISNPSPANLARSDKSIDYMRNIIRNGGASVDRSDQMPPWKNELYMEEIEAVTQYTFNLRKDSVHKRKNTVPETTTGTLYIISNAALGVESITPNQARNIWLGRAQMLDDGEYVLPVNQGNNSETRNRFYRAVTGKTHDQANAHWIKLVFSGRQTPLREIKGDKAVIEWVAQTPNALGYVSTLSYNKAVKVLLTVK